MKNLIDTYLDEMLAEGKAEKTVATYRSALYRFAREIGKVLPEIASRDVHRWLMGLKGISTFRRHNVRCALAGFFNWCRRWEYIPVDRDIMFQVGKIKRHEVAKQWLTQAQVRLVAEEGCSKALGGFLKWKTRALIKFIGWTSVRLNEALSLRWSDIHADRGCFDYRLKGGRIDTYPIDANIVRVLREYRVHYDRWQKMAKRKGLRSPEVCAKLGYVFPARTGGKWWHAYDAMKAAGKSVGVVVHAHKIRHSVAQWYVEGGGPVEGLQIIMGHKNIATTQGYYQRHLKIKKRARKSINFNL